MEFNEATFERKFFKFRLAMANHAHEIEKFIDHPEYKDLPEYAEAAAINRVCNRVNDIGKECRCSRCKAVVDALDWKCESCGKYI